MRAKTGIRTGKIVSVALALSLLASIGTYTKGVLAQEVSYIDIDLEGLGFDGNGFPFGIECGNEADPFVYITIDDTETADAQGLLAKISKVTKESVAIFVNPDEPLFDTLGIRQHFYSIARDPNNGNLFINERDNGKLWRFEPATNTWTPIPLIEQLQEPPEELGLPSPYFEYGVKNVDGDDVIFDDGYTRAPNVVRAHTNSIGDNDLQIFTSGDGSVVFANGFIWVGLAYFIGDEFTVEDGVTPIHFAGLAKVDPATAQVVERIPLGFDTDEDFFIDSGAIGVTGLVADFANPNILWITDIDSDKIFRFDTNGVEDVIEIQLEGGSKPRGIDTDVQNIFVALNKLGGEEETSQILKINKSNTDEQTIIDTTADNTADGTFTIFVQRDEFGQADLLVWTDQSQHVGIIGVQSGPPPVVEDTETIRNHFGCVPFDGEFWFAGQGSARVGIQPNSKFSVGGRARPTSSGSSFGDGSEFADPNTAHYDDQPPQISDVFTTKNGGLEVFAKITDNVGVKNAKMSISKNVYEMKQKDGNPLIYTAKVSNPPSGTVFFKIVARDFNDNTAMHEGSTESSGASSLTGGPSFAIKPLTMGEVHTSSNYAITATASGLNDPNVIPKPQITIQNTSNEPLQNIRLMLSPELKGKFRLSEYAISTIEPNSEATVSLIMNGKPSVDAMGNPIPYNGYVIISVNNSTPYVLEINGYIPNDSDSLRNLFMDMLSKKADDRYRTMQLPDNRISQAENYRVTLASGSDAIKSTSDELIITNTGDLALKNVRLMTSLLSDHFLLDQKNIQMLPAGSFVKVKLVSKMNGAESPNLKGELLVVPEFGNPLVIPIDIGKVSAEDKNSKYQVTTLSGNDIVSNTADALIIKNKSNEAIKNMRVVLTRGLEGVFSLSEDSFPSIEPNTEKVIYLQQRGTLDSVSKQILSGYSGEVIILSDNGMKKIIPISISWKDISSEHFVVYARNNAEELLKAAQLINFLERNYPRVAQITGETMKKTTIYMPTSLDEMKLLTGTSDVTSTYIYGEDLVFVYSKSDYTNTVALKEFVYRMIMKNSASYGVRQQVSINNGNWLIDGVSNYIAAKIVGERGLIREQIDAFVEKPTSLEWYGTGTLAQYGATYMLFKQLAEKYGDKVIDKTLMYLGSSMVSNHRCSTLEQCTLLRAVYSASSMDINDKRYELNFNTLVNDWRSYVEPQIIAGLNTFQRAEFEKALANLGSIPLTNTENAVLALVRF